MNAHQTPVIGVILAAGSGRRFGGDKRQALLPGGASMLDTVLVTWTSVLPTVWVLGLPGDTFAPSACQRHGAAWMPCEDSQEGMGHTLACAARRATAGAPVSVQALLVGLADMPLVASSTLHALVGHAGSGRPAAPRHQGRLGHPRLLPRALWPVLTRLQGDEGARHAVDWSAGTQVEVDDPGVLMDIDTREALAGLTASTPSGPHTLG